MQQDVPYLPELRGEPLLAGLSEGETLTAFVEALRRHGAKVAKAQLAGPATLAAHGLPGVLQQLPAKVRRLTARLAQTGATPLVFLDEPALHEAEVPVASLELVRRVASDAGALVGLHCCGQARWPELLGLGFDVLSIDARLSLDAVLEDRGAWLRFLEGGGRLCLGIIPTTPGARYDVIELCDSVEASLRATTPHFARELSRMLLAPACGLALHPAPDALRITAEVKQAQARLRALL